MSSKQLHGQPHPPLVKEQVQQQKKKVRVGRFLLTKIQIPMLTTCQGPTPT